MRKILLTMTLFIFAAAIMNPAFGAGKPKKSVKVNAMNMTASRGADPKIKSARPSSDKPEQAHSARGLYCEVDFYNHTGYTIDIYVDGNYKGTLGAYNNGSVTVYSGYTTIYCVSVGKTKYWEASGNCDGTYTYDLYN